MKKFMNFLEKSENLKVPLDKNINFFNETKIEEINKSENYINSIESTINIFYPPNVIKPCNEIINIINYQIKKNTVNRS